LEELNRGEDSPPLATDVGADPFDVPDSLLEVQERNRISIRRYARFMCRDLGIQTIKKDKPLTPESQQKL
jgi:hypothetical protein